MKIEIKGMSELQKVFKNIPTKGENAAHKELKEIVLDLQGNSQELAPVDLGDLRGSAFSEVTKLDGTVGFTEPYALRQHEGVGFRHPKGGQAKFLETPYKANASKYANSLMAAIKKAVGD